MKEYSLPEITGWKSDLLGVDMADYEGFLRWPPLVIGPDPIGPWVRVALDQEVIDSEQAAALTVTEVGLQKEAIALQRQALDLQERALDAIAESTGRHRQT